MVLAANLEVVHLSAKVLVQSSVLESAGLTTHGAFCFTVLEQAITTSATEVLSATVGQEWLREQLDADLAKVVLRRFVHEMNLPFERLHGVLRTGFGALTTIILSP